MAGATMVPGHSPAAEKVISAALVHTRENFDFVANASLEVAWPLFGAERERLWAPGWDPVFLWPRMPSDQSGTVFTIAHGDTTAIWVTTAFDEADKTRVQYAYVIPDVLVTLITLKLTPAGKSTLVAVTYERTALTTAANEAVSKMAARDRLAGPEWGGQINDYLKRQAIDK
ncbi:MAG TPA: hypothetical protein VGI65_07000 [Steroidobacteraceae bacterium]|jgi:hypothetical protein